MPGRDHPTIDVVLGEFLAEQRERLSARTLRTYDEVLELLRHSLDGFGPEKIPEHLGEFLAISWCAR
jgi:hypothetical protein